MKLLNETFLVDIPIIGASYFSTLLRNEMCRSYFFLYTIFIFKYPTSSPRKKPLHQVNPEMFKNWALKV